ncbi:hypothetical protein [Candidatus Uabimicrobium amorphum]|uniref:Uncharacterized protein n=1 Tax=Uabimicrobium amorphum TaxID=2596890 RepID=A0A5S9IMU9_UABAM|nr:hypothetical protein [Candidatus Uabimicrobium amorphum]BBM84437.1 hypothetical protein UABAM_02797 [Candidatus Uabimicrobium amorphum]
MEIITRPSAMGKSLRMLKKDRGDAILETVKWILHSEAVLGSGTGSGNQNLTFFRSSSGTNDRQTNLKTDGQLAKPNEFFLYGITVFCPNGADVADIANLFNFGVLRFKISGKEYVNARLHYVPPGGGIQGYGYADSVGSPTTRDFVTNGVPLPNTYYNVSVMKKPLHIVDQESFEASIDVIGGGDFNTAMPVTYGLHGILARPTV